MPFDPSKIDLSTLSQSTGEFDLGEGLDTGNTDELKFSMGEATKIDPVKHAEAMALGEEAGAPGFPVKGDAVQLKSNLKVNKIDFPNMEKNSPKTMGWMADFNNAVIAQDDVTAMGELESLLTPVADVIRAFAAAPVELAGGGVGGIGQINQDVGRAVSEGIRSLGGEAIADFLQKPGSLPIYLDPGASLAETGELIAGAAETIAPPEARETFATMVGGALGQIGAYALAPSTALTAFFSSSYKQGRDKAAAAGADEQTQTAAGMLYGLTTLASEKTGMDLIFKRIPPNIRNATVRRMVDVILGSGIEGAEELIEGITHQLIDKGLYDPEAEIDVVPGAEEGSAATAAGIVRLLVGGKLRAAQGKEAAADQQSELDQVRIDQIDSTVKNIKMREHSKEAFKRFVGSVDSDGTVFIDGAQTTLYLQTKTAEEIQADPALTLLNEQAREASALGGDVQVSVADFATDIAGTDHFVELRDSMTLSGETASPFRQEQVKQETDNYIKALVAEAQLSTDEYVQAQEIFTQVREQLVDSGQVNAQNASIMAEIVPAWATAQARRTGKTVQQVYEDSGLSVVGPQTGEKARLAGEEALAQPAYKDAPLEFDRVRDAFLDVLPEDATFEDLAGQISEFTPEQQNFLRALERDEYLGFDHPSQAINAALSGEIDTFEVSTGLKQSIGRMVNVAFGADVLAQDIAATAGFTPVQDSAEFVQAITEAKGSRDEGAFVYQYPEEDYKDMQLFTGEDGKVGFAVKEDGDIVSVFKHADSETKGALDKVIPLAIEMGGTKLDAFEGFLTESYARFGFEEVRREPWNDENAPPNWDYEKFGTPDVVYMELPAEARKDGTDFRDFFAGVTEGEIGLSDTAAEYSPVIGVVADQIAVEGSDLSVYGAEYMSHKGKFDDHIAMSIPGYRDAQYAFGDALIKTFSEGGTMLDLGASEGTQAKTVTSLSGGKIKSISLDPNQSMEKSFETISQVEGATYSRTALGVKPEETGFAWDEADGAKTYYFDSKGEKFDIVQEAMVFQFIANNRDQQIARMAELTKDDGIAIIQEKVFTSDWQANEDKKNTEYKSKYFGKESLDAKSAEVLEGMNKNMVTQKSLEDTLLKEFDFVEQVWDAGNFKGYVASNSADRLKEFTGNLVDTRSEFDTRTEAFAQPVSTRLPSGVKTVENPLEDMLIIGLDASKQDRRAFEKNIGIIEGYENYRPAKSANTPDKKAERFINHVVDNLLWLHDEVPAGIRERSKLWYEGARRITDNWADQYDATDSQVAGVLAVLSPQKDWYMNVTLGERVLDVFQNQQDFQYDDAMAKTAGRIFAKDQYQEMIEEISTQKLGEIDDAVFQAAWVRIYDQTYNTRSYQIVSPEGSFTGWVETQKGAKAKAAWGSLGEISKAVSILKDGSIENVSLRLGGQHKVRNFYNNIFNPQSEHGDVTIDTHAVAAALLKPLASASTEVSHNFGTGSASSKFSGSRGTYGLYAEAYRRAAKKRDILPRELQSITWEAVRGLFTPGFKAQKKNTGAVNAIWLKYKKGRLSLNDTRKQIQELAGVINPPTWHRPDGRGDEQTWDSSYQNKLPRVQLPGQEGRRVGRGGAAPAARDRRVTERRTSGSKAREMYDALTRDELIDQLLKHELTGIKGRKAFVVDVQDAKAVASIDADSLKWINDNLSPDHGDALLEAVADSLDEQTEGAYHISGDEFYVLGETEEEVKAIVDSAVETLSNVSISATKPDGTTVTLVGLNITHGIGVSKSVADQKLKTEKVAKEKAGERAPRGQQPFSATVRTAEGIEVSRDERLAQPVRDTSANRGYYEPANSIIRLTEAANLSTFLHEFAHFMYEKEVDANSEMLQSINGWFRRNAESVAKEAVTYDERTTTKQPTNVQPTPSAAQSMSSSLAGSRLT